MDLGVEGYETVSVTQGAGEGKLVVGNGMVIVDKATYAERPILISNHDKDRPGCSQPASGAVRPRDLVPTEPFPMTEPTRSTPPFLQLRGIHKRFGGVHALSGVDLTIEAGKAYHLLGENGCGKSTVIKIMSGAHAPTEGSILLDGELVPKLYADGSRCRRGSRRSIRTCRCCRT